ncbi:SCO0930 family lipoprotein [Streptomyces sp. NBC_00876]|uniref:SCO0930 family lipoprotein n=1 Tax=Streptomyces sp. NBC_00876 TaxID=2975853 RepID=UPI003869B97A|nr:SCO0930 family lipoprotein [Streptomyces sp. NBC_00876]
MSDPYTTGSMFRAARRHAGHLPDSPDGGDLGCRGFEAPENSVDGLNKEDAGARTHGHERRGPASQQGRSATGVDTNPEPASAKRAGQLAVRDSERLGKVVTDGEGFTLYRFDKGAASPPTSNCEGDCAKAWPPLPAGNVTAAAGTDAALIGKVTRADGTRQLTLAGWPVHRYAKDAEPGDAQGQGAGGTWFAVAPDGKKAAVNADGPSGAEPAGLSGLPVRKDPKLGDIVVDKRGMTVCRFKKDVAWPMKSACTGACLSMRPVVAPLARNDVKSVTTKGFVTFDRPDGLKRQAIDCRPVYTYSGDIGPGDTNGQGIGGTWYAVPLQTKLVDAPK